MDAAGAHGEYHGGRPKESQIKAARSGDSWKLARQGKTEAIAKPG